MKQTLHDHLTATGYMWDLNIHIEMLTVEPLAVLLNGRCVYSFCVHRGPYFLDLQEHFLLIWDPTGQRI